MDHPTPTILRSFLQQTLSQDEVRAVVAHLLTGCARCSAEIASLRETLSRQQALAKDLPTIGPSYDAAFERALAATLDRASSIQTKERKDILGEDEAKLPPEANKLVALYKDLLRQSWELRHKDPAKMLQLARRATIVANALSPRRYGAQKVADCQCRAWAELGNAYRVTEDHEAAEDALERAQEVFARGTQRGTLQARILNFKASLAGDRWDLENACSSLEFAYQLYIRARDHHLAGRTLIQKGVYAGFKRDLETSLRTIRQGIAWIDKSREPELPYVAIHNLAGALKDNGCWREAQTVLRSPLGRKTNSGGQMDRLKRWWLEGEILSGLGEYELAEQALLRVKGRFEQVGLLYQAAIVSIDLGTVWRHLGRKEEARDLSEETEGVFRSLHINPAPRGSFPASQILRCAQDDTGASSSS